MVLHSCSVTWTFQDGWFEDEDDLWSGWMVSSHDENDKEDGHRRALLLRNVATLLFRSSATLLLVPR